MITFQEWLNNKYPNKEGVEKIEFEIEKEKYTESDLVITDFPNLEEIKIYRRPYDELLFSPISKCEIKNCPKLKMIHIWYFLVKEFITDDLPNLTTLELDGNNLTSLDISKYPKLSVSSWKNNNNLQSPFQSLTQKIQQKEQELFSIKETELTTELNQIKQQKENLETNIQELHNTDFQKSKDLENQQEKIKQLQSKITLLEQQKNTYQEKFNNSLQFIKDLRKELAQGEEWKPKSTQ